MARKETHKGSTYDPTPHASLVVDIDEKTGMLSTVEVYVEDKHVANLPARSIISSYEHKEKGAHTLEVPFPYIKIRDSR